MVWFFVAVGFDIQMGERERESMCMKESAK